jgi:Ca-activated chloride channel family protein
MAIVLLVLLAGCQASASGSASPSTEASASASAEGSHGGTGEASLDAPDEVEAGADFEVSWTGPDGEGDYVTIVEEGARRWTNEPYFYTADGSTGTLVASTSEGEYEIWYVRGDDEEVLATRPITVTPFEGALLAPAQVMGNTEFEVSWNGPDGPGDYITIVPESALRWTNEDYFYTADGSTGTLLAPVEAGDYEIWYVAGADDSVFATRPIQVNPTEVSIESVTAVDAGAQFEVTWDGPDGPGDYLTIVPARSAEGTYLSYAYTADGNPLTLTAPDETGDFEVRYVAGQDESTLAAFDITVR